MIVLANQSAKLRIGGLLLVPFLGICAGVFFSGLEILAFQLSHAVAVPPLTLLLGLLVWLQLGSMLLVERKDSKR